MPKYYAEVAETLVWAVVLDVPDNIAADPVDLSDYVYEHWGMCEDKDIRHDGECEIVTLEPYSEK